MKKSLFSGVAFAAMLALSSNAYADLLIGVGGPMTGPNAAFGAQLQKGAEAAVAAINAAGGVNRRADRGFRSAMTFPIQSRVFRLPINLLQTA